MRRLNLTKEEQWIEDHLEGYAPVSKEKYNKIAQLIESRKKDAVLNIRVNSYDLEHIKQKAQKLGVKYQTFISEILHKVAEGV